MEQQQSVLREQRREFLQRAASLCGITLCSGALAGLLASCESDTVKSTGASAALNVADEPALQQIGGAVKKTFGANNGGRPVIVVRTGEEAFVAFSSVCPHAGCEVSAPSIAGAEIVCDQIDCGHGSVFSPTDGSVQFGPATAPLRSFSTTYKADTQQVILTF